MIIYFDTNIYDYIAETAEEHALRSFLTGCGITVLVSSTNVLEIQATSDPTYRAKQFAALAIVGDEFEPEPQSFLHAKELLDEVARCRPQWLRTRPDRTLYKQALDFLRHHADTWQTVRAFRSISDASFSMYIADAEPGIQRNISYQTELGKVVKNNAASKVQIGVSLPLDRQDLPHKLAPLAPETYWRLNCMTVWRNAVVDRIRASRDYADWVLPFLRPDAFLDESYRKFWMEDVKAGNLPRNKIMSLVSYYQLSYKVTRGNSMDELHASVLPDVDIFVTADRRFKLALDHVAAGSPRKVVLVERKGPSCLAALRRALATE